MNAPIENIPNFTPDLPATARLVGRVWFDDDGTFIPSWLFGKDSPLEDPYDVGLILHIANQVCETTKRYYYGRKIVELSPGLVLIDYEKYLLGRHSKKSQKQRLASSLKELESMRLIEFLDRRKSYSIVQPCLDSQDAIIRIGDTPISRVPASDWPMRRQVVFERDGHVCQDCGNEDGPFECDHIVPVSKGGSDDLGNLQTLCQRCNRSKGARLHNG